MFLVLFILGVIGGFLSGLLGIGGAMIMIPLMLFVPPLLGAGTLTMKEVAGLSMIQVVFSSLSGVTIHRRNRCVCVKLLLNLGIAMAIGSGFGATVSKFMDDRLLLIVFGIITTVAAIMMFLPEDIKTKDISDPDAIEFNKPLSIFIGFTIGCLSGIVGAGGGFIIVPCMMYILKIPLRITIGTSLGIVLIGAIIGAMGKIATGQVGWLLALALIIGSVPSAQIGSMVSKRTPTSVLRLSLLVLIVVITLQIWYKVIWE